MHFCSLYRYSYRKSPKDLRPAVIACRLTFIFAIFAIILFIFSLSCYSYQNGPWFVDRGDIKQSINSSQSSRQEEHPWEIHNLYALIFTDYTAFVSLIVTLILSLLIIVTIIYAYLTYNRYQQSRLVCYQLVNRSFDQLQREQLAKVHIRQPIITKENGATVLVPKNSPIPEWLQMAEKTTGSNNNNNNRSKLANWARSKWSRQDRSDDLTNNNNNRHLNGSSRPISKDMTI
ncbi:hypothetical protein BLOT_001609 [Blomia tropicalis]|nr:hypothetical protein BLOT_001609 [Blomia tropicalis]